MEIATPGYLKLKKNISQPATSMQTILDDITRTSIQLILKEPFYGHFFSNLVREVSDVVDTLGVAARQDGLVTLSVNEQFWVQELTKEDYKYGVIKHEILHVLFKHILMIGDFSNRQLANVAMDIVVNQYIDKKQLPGEPVLLEKFPDLRLQHDQSVQYYYEKLLQLYRQEVKKRNPNDSFKALKQFIGEHSGKGKKTTIGDHSSWQPLTEAERKVIEGGIDALIHNVLDRAVSTPQFGNLPWGIRDYLKNFREVTGANLDWRRVLRLFSATSSKTYLKNTIKRVSKRYGTVPGIKVKHKNKLLVAIDTSGSTSTDDHNRFFQEIQHIYKQGAEIMVVECDTHIQNQYFYGGQPPDYVSGRGGTDFEAPIIFANEEYGPDAIIYFTDGFGAVPQTVPRMPILWVITPGGVVENQGVWPKLPGRKVKMNNVP